MASNRWAWQTPCFEALGSGSFSQPGQCGFLAAGQIGRVSGDPGQHLPQSLEGAGLQSAPAHGVTVLVVRKEILDELGVQSGCRQARCPPVTWTKRAQQTRNAAGDGKRRWRDHPQLSVEGRDRVRPRSPLIGRNSRFLKVHPRNVHGAHGGRLGQHRLERAVSGHAKERRAMDADLGCQLTRMFFY